MKVKSLKIWIAICIEIFLSVFATFFQDNAEILDILIFIVFSGFLVWTAFSVTKKQRKSSVRLLIALLVAPRILHVLYNCYLFMVGEFELMSLIGSGFSAIAISVVIIRLVLQWTTPIWKQETHCILSRMKFWKRYISFESYILGVIVFLIATFLWSDLGIKIYSSIPALLGLWGIPAIYKRYIMKPSLTVLVEEEVSVLDEDNKEATCNLQE